MNVLSRRSVLGAAGLPFILAASPYPGQRILVLGDSVTWGQGLRDGQKMHSVLARMLFDKIGLEPTLLHYACSGGIIGSPSLPPQVVPGWWPREIPRDDPTLYEQCSLVEADHPDRRFDVIILAGGINDVGVSTIFNPLTSVADIETRCQQYCRTSMGQFLNRLNQQFVTANPQVKICVLGYYSVFSDLSAIPKIGNLFKALAIGAVRLPRPNPSQLFAVQPLTLQDLLVRNSTAFRDASRSNLLAAVNDANAQTATNNFAFIDPMITDEEAAFAPKALIWGLDNDEAPEDPIADDREKYCDDLLDKHLVDQFQCERACVGHPNIDGAHRYAEKLFAALTNVPVPQPAPPTV